MMHWQRCTARLGTSMEDLERAWKAWTRAKEIGMSYWLDHPRCLMIVEEYLCSITDSELT